MQFYLKRDHCMCVLIRDTHTHTHTHTHAGTFPVTASLIPSNLACWYAPMATHTKRLAYSSLLAHRGFQGSGDGLSRPGAHANTCTSTSSPAAVYLPCSTHMGVTQTHSGMDRPTSPHLLSHPHSPVCVLLTSPCAGGTRVHTSFSTRGVPGQTPEA